MLIEDILFPPLVPTADSILHCLRGRILPGYVLDDGLRFLVRAAGMCPIKRYEDRDRRKDDRHFSKVLPNPSPPNMEKFTHRRA